MPPTRARRSIADKRTSVVIPKGTPHLPGPDTVQPGRGVVVTEAGETPALRKVRQAAEAKRVLRGKDSARPAKVTSQIPEPRKKRENFSIK